MSLLAKRYTLITNLTVQLIPYLKTLFLLHFIAIRAMAKQDIEVDVPTRVRSTKRRIKEPVLTETLLGVLSIVTVMVGVLLIFSMVHAGGTGGERLFSGLNSLLDRKSTRLNSSHSDRSRMPSSA